MATDKVFVGRKYELEQFKEVLADPRGQAERTYRNNISIV